VEALASFLTAVYVMWYRQLKRFVRAKSRLAAAIVHPTLWMVFFGLGWASTFRMQPSASLFGGVDYPSFLAPGVAMMAVFSVAFMSGISVIWDREFGFLKEMLVAPVPREAIILGRALGDSTVAVLQGIIILLIASFMAPRLNLASIPMVTACMFLVALSYTGVGITIGSRMTSMEGFQLINSVISLPTLFLSGVFYPVATMPGWMKVLAFMNPLTYGVDAGRNLLVGVGYLPIYVNFLVLLGMAASLVGFTAWAFRSATID